MDGLKRIVVSSSSFLLFLRNDFVKGEVMIISSKIDIFQKSNLGLAICRCANARGQPNAILYEDISYKLQIYLIYIAQIR